MKRTTEKNIAQLTAKLLRGVLKIEANTGSSIMAYEPKVPTELEKFKLNKTASSQHSHCIDN